MWDFINGAAESYLSYGFVDLHVAEYKKGKNVIRLEIYRHSDHIMAFGIYSTERSPSFKYMKLGSQGYKTESAINFFKGNYYVKIRTYSKSEKTLQSAESLALNVLPRCLKAALICLQCFQCSRPTAKRRMKRSI